RPFVVLKLAQTLDGRIATAAGESRWISGRESLKLAHRLRSEVDAVVVGMGTVRQDNPLLTVRYVKGSSPYRIVLSRSLDFPRGCHLLNRNSDGRTILATTESSYRRFRRMPRGKNSNLIVWQVRGEGRSRLDLPDFLARAEDFGLRSLLVEGGAALATSFLRAGLVDKLVLVTAPVILGEGVNSVGDLHVRQLQEAIRFRRFTFDCAGSDSIFIGCPKRTA
ncbi:MAG: RibD family protein, partial [Candidatus Zixiibacteriota bacterium]